MAGCWSISTKAILTYRSEGIREKMPDTFVEVSPELAEERGIQSGTWVQLISRYGKVRVRAVVTDRVHGKELYMPMNSCREPGEPTHQQPHGQNNSYARIQGNLGQPTGALPEIWRKPTASHQFTLRPSHAETRRRGGAQMETRGLSSSWNPRQWR